MKIESEILLDFDDVLIKPKRSSLNSRNDVNLKRKFKFPYSPKTWEGVPIIASNMIGVGTFSMVDALSKFDMITCVHKKYGILDWTDFVKESLNEENFNRNYIYTLGTDDNELSKLLDIINITKIGDADFAPNIICLDVANGYHDNFADTVSRMRDRFKYSVIIAGNVATPEMTEQLILSGADIVKVGIGPGSVCTTRLKTGVGIPQLSAIIDCADAAHGLNGHIIADGGCRTSGDIAKAFGAGADFVMLGGMLAAHDEGETDFDHETTDHDPLFPDVVDFYGSASSKFMKVFKEDEKKYRAAEGKSVKLKKRGPVENTIKDILGGLRSTCSYVGARQIKDLTKCCTFVIVRHQLNEVYGKAY